MRGTQFYPCRKLQTCNSRGRDTAEEEHGSPGAGATGHNMGRMSHISEEGEAG